MLRDATRSFIASRSPRSRVRELASSRLRLRRRRLGDGGLTRLVRHARARGARRRRRRGSGGRPRRDRGRGARAHAPPGAVRTGERGGGRAHARRDRVAARQALLPALVAGTTVATWAIADGPGEWLPTPSDARRAHDARGRHAARRRVRGLRCEAVGGRRRERRASPGDVPARRWSRAAPDPGRRAGGHGVPARDDGPRPAHRRRRAP